jgi:hypothetical protein
MKTIAIGDEVTYGELKGKVVSRTQFLAGCVRMGIETKKFDNDGHPIQNYVDEALLVKNYEVSVLDPILGKRYKDKITGFSGTATSVTHHVNGTILVGLESKKLDRSGRPVSATFDMERLDHSYKKKLAVAEKKPLKPGGPMKVPHRF